MRIQPGDQPRAARLVVALGLMAGALALGLAGEARGANPAPPAAATGRPPTPDEVRVDEHLGASVPLDLAFTASDGRRVRLADALAGDRPTVLVLYYDRCPMLCGLVLNGLIESLRKLDWKLGKDYRGLTVSIDPDERPADAARKQRQLLSKMGSPGGAASWPFLVGDEPAISALARSVGFVYAKVPASRDYAHPAVVVVLGPGGKVSRYLYGVSYPPRDLRLALVEASEGRSGSSFERFLLRCYRYDPATHRYELQVRGIFRLGGAIVLAAFGLFLVRLWRHDGRRA